jgi:hypothetical protein
MPPNDHRAHRAHQPIFSDWIAKKARHDQKRASISKRADSAIDFEGDQRTRNNQQSKKRQLGITIKEVARMTLNCRIGPYHAQMSVMGAHINVKHDAAGRHADIHAGYWGSLRPLPRSSASHGSIHQREA